MSVLSPARMRRVGHKGADRIVPGNTLASFDAALEAGVDMIEFDVLPERAPATRLLIAHDYEDAARREPLTLDQGLDYLAGTRFSGVEFDVDLKVPGYEQAVLSALRERGLLARSLICTQHPRSLVALRALERSARLGWSVPKLRRDPFRSRGPKGGAWLALQIARAGLPARAAAAIGAGHCQALMAHWRLITPRLVREVTAAGGELYVWTVDDVDHIRSLQALGVSGVITNDPRLFAALV